MKKTLAIVLFVLAFPLSAMAHGGIEHGDLIIKMTGNGFEPKEYAVVEGDEVLFINDDDISHWPASNFHPTHTLYPEFDPKTDIKPGESWKMVFSKVGTWRMHDHLVPHMTGTIVVLKDPDKTTPAEADPRTGTREAQVWQKIKAFFSKLFSTGASSVTAVDQKALAEFKSLDEVSKYAWLNRRAELEDPKVAWEYVLATYNTPEGVVGSPHDMAHLVGQLIFKKYGLDGLSICKPVFAFGCYHGLMEVTFSGNTPSDYQKNVLSAEAGCKKIGEENPAYWSCIHGMGHGIITFREHDIHLALRDCDLLKEGVRHYCYDGIFMELSVSAVPSFYKKSDPLFPCSALPERYLSGCARAQARVMQSRLGLKISEVAQKCLESKDRTKTIRYHCIESLGYSAAQANLKDPKVAIAYCNNIANDDDQAQCKEASAGEFVFQNAVGWKASSAMICESLKANYKSDCEARVAQVKKIHGRE